LTTDILEKLAVAAQDFSAKPVKIDIKFFADLGRQLTANGKAELFAGASPNHENSIVP
jgi:hypothetical protein